MQATQDKKLTESKAKRVDSRVLLGAEGQLVIVHRGREYCLRLTRNGKLILTA